MQRLTHSLASSPWPERLHLALTAVLVVMMASVAGLVLAGRVSFTPVARVSETKLDKKNQGKEEAGTSSRQYEIEKLDECRDILNRAGRSEFLGDEWSDAWVFKYKGGLLECRLEADLEADQPPLVLPSEKDFQRLCEREAILPKDSPPSADRTGYIILLSGPVSEELARHHVHLGGLLSFGSYGPLHVLAPLNLEVVNRSEYRLFVSITPPKGGYGMDSNLWTKRLAKVRTPIILRNPDLEEYHAGARKNLQPGKEEIILDRQRGYSRLRLKARFLGDGEVQALRPK